MSQQQTVLSSADYKVELARTIAQWVPHDQLIAPGAPSGFAGIKVTDLYPDGLEFTVRDPTGAVEEWAVSWQTLLAYGGLKRSEN